MFPYAIGLDIGITSVGWAVVALDHQENPCAILDMGARIFDAAEHPKTGASLAAPRREARSARRRLRRHQHRNWRIRQLLIAQKVLSEEELDSLFSGVLEDIYALRVTAPSSARTRVRNLRGSCCISHSGVVSTPTAERKTQRKTERSLRR